MEGGAHTIVEMHQRIISSQALSSFIQVWKEQLTQWRRDLHQYPEVGWTEYRTTFTIGNVLSAFGFTLAVGKDALVSSERMGVPPEDTLAECEARARLEGVSEAWLEKMKGGHTGLVAQWDTGRAGAHLAFRFDIDALPIQEARDESHIPEQEGFRSVHEGEMHACAHDGHAAIGLGVAAFIHTFADQLTGKFTLLFQPAEEGCRGARAMVAKGWLDDADYFLSGHIGIRSLPVGMLVATTSGFLATTKIDATYKGKSAHAGVEPQKGKNALLAVAAAALHLHGISRHADGATRMNVGRISAGSGRNMIADYGKIELETRGETTEINQFMVEETRRILRAVADMYDVEVELGIVGEGYGAESDDAWISIVEQACADSQSVNRVIPRMDVGASEDVTYMMRRVQENGGLANYMIFCTPLKEGHHNPKFDYREEVLPVAVEVMCRLIAACQKQ
jgi:aminobenzoyl-glutamate utilization protein A